MFGYDALTDALAACPRMRAVKNRGANVQSASQQRATISGTSCCRRGPTQPVSSAVSKYQPPTYVCMYKKIYNARVLTA